MWKSEPTFSANLIPVWRNVMTDVAQRGTPAPEPPTVAIVLNEDGTYHDRCFTWETGQSFALSEGMRVVAVADDGQMTMDDAQRLYDAERARYRDCYGLSEDKSIGTLGRWSNDA
jgi:hypothetical protein